MNEPRRRRLSVFLLIFALILIRFSFYGPTYFYQLDDYIQYHNYMAYHPDAGALIQALGLLAARPLAGLADLFVWSAFFPVMYLAVAILSALYAASALLFQSVLSRHVRCGWGFLLVYSILPLGFEGTYWVSASSRVVCGLFFTALSAWLFQHAMESGSRARWALLAGFALSQLAAFGFYEQALVLSFGLTLLLALLNRKQCGRAALWGLWSFASLGMFAAFTSAFSHSAVYGGRMKLILPFSGEYWSEFLPRLWERLSQAFFQGGFHTLFTGFLRGGRIALRDGVWYLLLALALAAAVFFLARSQPEAGAPRPRWAGSVLGLLLALGPLAPFFILREIPFSLRGTVCSFPGIALLADSLLSLLFSRLPARRLVSAGLCAVFTFCCTVAGVSELHDYRQTTLDDQAVAQAIYSGTESLVDTLDLNSWKDYRIAVLAVEPSYLPEQNFRYQEHIHGVTESGWALTGILQWLSGDPAFPSVTPIPAREIVWQTYDDDAHTLSGYDALYLYSRADNSLSPVTLERGEAPNTLRLLRSDGSVCAVAAPDGLTYPPVLP